MTGRTRWRGRWRGRWWGFPQGTGAADLVAPGRAPRPPGPADRTAPLRRPAGVRWEHVHEAPRHLHDHGGLVVAAVAGAAVNRAGAGERGPGDGARPPLPLRRVGAPYRRTGVRPRGRGRHGGGGSTADRARSA